MLRRTVLMASTSLPYEDGRSMSVSTSSKYWNSSSLFKLSSSPLKSAPGVFDQALLSIICPDDGAPEATL